MVENQVQQRAVESEAPANGGSQDDLQYEDLVEDELVEDVSIDGMCGVY